MKVYILTRQHNDYDQYGEYFVAWFPKRPTATDIQLAIAIDDESIIDGETADHIVSGGGRRDRPNEDVWWHLRLVSPS
jgi:hypothetical protein